LRGLGHLQEAYDVARAGLEMAERQSEKRLLIWLNGELAFIQADLGLDEEAAASSQRAMQWADELGQVTLQCWSYYARAHLHIQREEWEPALEVCRRGVALYAPTESRVSALYIGRVAAEAGWGAGRLAEAEQQIIAYIALAHETGVLQHEGIGLRVQGQIYAAQGRWGEAGQAFAAAIARFEELGSRLELGRALYYRSALRHAQGQVDAGGADAERARALFEACGAARDLEKARQPGSPERLHSGGLGAAADLR
jgi:tetratricopeptide (TPR) repeat protein